MDGSKAMPNCVLPSAWSSQWWSPGPALPRFKIHERAGGSVEHHRSAVVVEDSAAAGEGAADDQALRRRREGARGLEEAGGSQADAQPQRGGDRAGVARADVDAGDVDRDVDRAGLAAG